MIFSCTKFDGSMALNILISILQGGNEFRLFSGRDLFFCLFCNLTDQVLFLWQQDQHL